MTLLYSPVTQRDFGETRASLALASNATRYFASNLPLPTRYFLIASLGNQVTRHYCPFTRSGVCCPPCWVFGAVNGAYAAMITTETRSGF